MCYTWPSRPSRHHYCYRSQPGSTSVSDPIAFAGYLAYANRAWPIPQKLVAPLRQSVLKAQAACGEHGAVLGLPSDLVLTEEPSFVNFSNGCVPCLVALLQLAGPRPSSWLAQDGLNGPIGVSHPIILTSRAFTTNRPKSAGRSEKSFVQPTRKRWEKKIATANMGYWCEPCFHGRRRTNNSHNHDKMAI